MLSDLKAKVFENILNQGQMREVLGLQHNDHATLPDQLMLIAERRQKTHQPHYVMVLQNFDIAHLSYAMSPLILSVLKYKTILIGQKTEALVQVLSEYFRVDALALQHPQALAEMDICFDLCEANQSNHELMMYAVAQALCNENCRYVIMNHDDMRPELTALLNQYHIQVISQQQQPQAFQVDDIEFKKLFWKRKNDQMAHICQQITAANVDLISTIHHMGKQDTARLIDDLMYSEHLFEKVSVFGEFTETIYKHYFK